MKSNKALLLAALIAFTPALPASAEDIVIGASLGLTGYGSITDGHWRDGLELAIETVNATPPTEGNIEVLVTNVTASPADR